MKKVKNLSKLGHYSIRYFDFIFKIFFIYIILN